MLATQLDVHVDNTWSLHGTKLKEASLVEFRINALLRAPIFVLFFFFVV